MRRLLSKLHHLINLHGIIYEYDLGAFDFNGKDAIILPNEYSFATIDQVPLEMVKDFSLKNREPGQFERTIQKNLEMPDKAIGVCILFRNTEIAALEWVFLSLDGVKHSEKYPKSEDAFYAMDAFVAYEHRGKDLHRLCFLKRFEIAKRAGKTVGYGIVRMGNEKAFRTNDRIGTRIGKAYKLQSLGRFLNIYRVRRVFLNLAKHQ